MCASGKGDAGDFFPGRYGTAEHRGSHTGRRSRARCDPVAWNGLLNHDGASGFTYFGPGSGYDDNNRILKAGDLCYGCAESTKEWLTVQLEADNLIKINITYRYVEKRIPSKAIDFQKQSWQKSLFFIIMIAKIPTIYCICIAFSHNIEYKTISNCRKNH